VHFTAKFTPFEVHGHLQKSRKLPGTFSTTLQDNARSDRILNFKFVRL
jgi:hypothetical protein